MDQWSVSSRVSVFEALLLMANSEPGRPGILAVDGRGGSGKSTLADSIQRELEDVAVVHTDDLAWYEPYFEWGHLLRNDVLGPLRAGRGLNFRPPQWELRGRAGAIEVPASSRLVVIEGVGSSQREVSELLDAAVWVQSDFGVAEQRGIARDIAEGQNGPAVEATAFWHEWMAEELSFFSRDRPWERADLVVAGTAPDSLSVGEIAVAAGPLTRR